MVVAPVAKSLVEAAAKRTRMIRGRAHAGLAAGVRRGGDGFLGGNEGDGAARGGRAVVEGESNGGGGGCGGSGEMDARRRCRSVEEGGGGEGRGEVGGGGDAATAGGGGEVAGGGDGAAEGGVVGKHCATTGSRS